MTQTQESASRGTSVNASAGLPQMSSAQQVSRLLGSTHSQTSDRPVFCHRRVRAGQSLVRAGDECHDLYVVNGGYFKTVFTDETGVEQVMNFPMKGTLIGADGIGSGCHINEVIALSDADVVVVPFDDLSELTQLAPGIDTLLFRAISQQLIEEQLAVAAIGTMCAETRLARFITSIGDQMGAQGYSRDVFNLQMSRRDIGNCLGMKIETVSRTLTAMTKKGMIDVNQREIKIVDRGALEQAAAGLSGKKSTAVQKTVKSVSVKKTKKPGRQKKTAAVATPWSGLMDMVGSSPVVAA